MKLDIHDITRALSIYATLKGYEFDLVRWSGEGSNIKSVTAELVGAKKHGHDYEDIEYAIKHLIQKDEI